MVGTAVISPSVKSVTAGEARTTPNIFVFHCVNALSDGSVLENGDFELRGLKLPCSSMLREFILLRAFESGADAVVVLACPEAECNYMQGSLRARKRVDRVKKMLDDIGLDGRRLNIFNINRGDKAAAETIIARTVADLTELGLSPTR